MNNVIPALALLGTFVSMFAAGVVSKPSHRDMWSSIMVGFTLVFFISVVIGVYIGH